MKKAIYAGTFDPMTLGHENIVRRGLNLCDYLVLAIAESQVKKPFFTLEERIDIAKDVFSDCLDHIEVVGFSGLLIDLAKRHQVKTIIRGIRTVSDFEYEFQMAKINRKLYSELDTIFLAPENEYSFVSGSMVREIAFFNGNISEFVRPSVESRVKEKLSLILPK